MLAVEPRLRASSYAACVHARLQPLRSYESNAPDAYAKVATGCYIYMIITRSFSPLHNRIHVHALLADPWSAAAGHPSHYSYRQLVTAVLPCRACPCLR